MSTHTGDVLELKAPAAGVISANLRHAIATGERVINFPSSKIVGLEGASMPEINQVCCSPTHTYTTLSHTHSQMFGSKEFVEEWQV